MWSWRRSTYRISSWPSKARTMSLRGYMRRCWALSTTTITTTGTTTLRIRRISSKVPRELPIPKKWSNVCAKCSQRCLIWSRATKCWEISRTCTSQPLKSSVVDARDHSSLWFSRVIISSAPSCWRIQWLLETLPTTDSSLSSSSQTPQPIEISDSS